jgi:hypothetical protein
MLVVQGVVEMGRAAAVLLFRRLEGSDGPCEPLVVGTRLVVRGSAELPVPVRVEPHRYDSRKTNAEAAARVVLPTRCPKALLAYGC